MRVMEPGDVVEELGISDKAGWCGVLELVPCACPREEVVSETCNSIFGAVSLAKISLSANDSECVNTAVAGKRRYGVQ
jgi:hypothetical protein